ncbi:MAG: RICIN domain-containing protein [Clostridiales bacterium]|nr:RICIN domain-containing protein [Clostridiales bacterium]
MKETARRIKKVVQNVLLGIAILAGSAAAMPAQAFAATSWPSVSSSNYITVYATSTGNNTAVYNSSHNVESNRYIYGSDDLRVIGIDGDWAKITYPVSGGRREAYIPLSTFTDRNVNSVTSTARANLTVYRRADGGTTLGSIYSGDSVTKIAERNGYSQVIYPVSSGWKCGYISNSSYNDYISPPSSSPVTIANGVYNIVSAVKSDMVIDCSNGSANNGENVLLWYKNASNGSTNQQVSVTSIGGGYYKLLFVHSGKAITVSGGVTNIGSGANVTQWVYGGGANEEWSIADAGNGWYYIIARHSGKYLDVAGGSSIPGTNIQVWDGNESAAQKWKFAPIAAESFNGIDLNEVLKFAKNDSNSSSGELCAEFVAQCLDKGYLKMPSTSVISINWLNGESSVKAASPRKWVPSQYMYLRDLFPTIDNPTQEQIRQVKPGDLIYVKTDSNFGHVMICTYNDGNGNIRCSARNKKYTDSSSLNPLNLNANMRGINAIIRLS